MFSYLSPEAKGDYAVEIAKTGLSISDKEFSLLSQEGKQDYAVAAANEGNFISNEQFLLLRIFILFLT